jgi:hypothetical protein
MKRSALLAAVGALPFAGLPSALRAKSTFDNGKPLAVMLDGSEVPEWVLPLMRLQAEETKRLCAAHPTIRLSHPANGEGFFLIKWVREGAVYQRVRFAGPVPYSYLRETLDPTNRDLIARRSFVQYLPVDAATDTEQTPFIFVFQTYYREAYRRFRGDGDEWGYFVQGEGNVAGEPALEFTRKQFQRSTKPCIVVPA